MKKFVHFLFCLFFVAAGAVYAGDLPTGNGDFRMDDPSCPCDSLHPTFSSSISGCTGDFASTIVLPPCMNTGFPVAYTWLVDGAFVGAGSTLNYTFPGSGTYNLCMIVYVMLPNDETCIKQICQQVTVEGCCSCDSLHPTFTGGVSGCTGDFASTTVLPECMNTGFPVAYTWLVDGAFAGAGATLNYSFPGNGTYNVCMIVYVMLPDGETCIQSVCHSFTVEECCPCDALQPSFSTSVSGCNGTFESTTDVPACMQIWADVQYDWTVNGAAVGSGTSLSYSFPGSGTYTVCLTITTLLPDGNDCIKTICQEVTVDCPNAMRSQGIENTSQPEQSVLLYPNPATDQLNIELVLKNAGDVNITLKSMDGKVVLTEKRRAEAGKQQLTLNLPASVANSVILVEITAGVEKIVRMVTVSNK